MEFITNRTQAHVTALKRLRQKNYWSLSASELQHYLNYASLGAYNYTDLNRVESNVAELAGMIGLSLTTKTDWSYADNPTRADLRRYLDNVVAIRDAVTALEEYPTLPVSMANLDYVGANAIERVLEIAYFNITGLNTTSELGVAVLGMMELGG